MFASSIAFLTVAFSLSVKLVLSATSVLVAGFAGSFFSASVLVFSSTKSLPLIVSVDLSGYVIVAVPSLPTSTVVPSGNLSLFASSIAFLTAAFSVSVKLVLSTTSVLVAGFAGSFFSASVLVFSSTKSLPLIVSVDLSGYVIVAVPSLPTSTVVPSGNLPLFASSIAFLTASFSVCVKLVLSATGVLSAGTTGVVSSACVLAFSSTKSVPLIVSVDPSGYVIVAVPSAPTSTFVGC